MIRNRRQGEPTRGIAACLLLCAAMLTAGCGRDTDGGTSAAILDRPWQDVRTAARGTRVNLFMWGGDDGYNRYIDDYARPAVSQRYGIELRRVPLTGAEATINKLLAEKRAGSRGSVDLIWINGQNFATGAAAGLWQTDWACDLPNARLIDWQSPAINRDFGYPVECREAPWSQAQFVMIYDSQAVDDPPRTPAELRTWAAAHPGRFTYPAPPDFTGTAFIEQLLVLLTGHDYQQSFDPALNAELTPRLWAYLEQLEPHLWRGGATYPASIEKLNELFINGEVDLTMSYNPQFAQRQILNGLFPASTRSYIFTAGTLQNTSYLAMPFNAPNPAGAAVVANFLQSPVAQIAKQDPARLGALTVLDPARLDPAQRAKLGDVRGAASLPLDRLAESRIPEPHHGWVAPLQRGWREQVARD